MKAKLYLDSSIPSYLTAFPSVDFIQYAMQLTTLEWWEYYRHHYDIYISAAVLKEISGGNANAAHLRIESVADIPMLAVSKNTSVLAKDILQKLGLPNSMMMDAIHVAICLENGISYFATWNLKHLANSEIKKRITFYCIKNDYKPLTICTPQELMEAWDVNK